MRWGWGPLRPGNAPRTLCREARNSRAEGTRKTKRPSARRARSKGSEGVRSGLRLDGRLTLSGGGRCVGEEGTGTEPNTAPVGAAEPGAVVCRGGGEGPGSRASRPRGRLLLSGQGAGGTARGHCSSSEDSWEMPSSSSFSFLGLPLGFLPGVVVTFRVLAAPLFLLPFGRPRGLFGVGTSLGSFGGCLRGLPRPRFSVPSFSCLEARGWLDFEPDSLILLLYVWGSTE